jgi:hypothetical protein
MGLSGFDRKIMESVLQLLQTDVPGACTDEAMSAHTRAIKDDLLILEADLRFLEAWERGEVHFLSAILRVRQMHRANPSLALGTSGL